MQQQIEKLKQEKNKLTSEYQNSRVEYKAEIKRIDRAIKNFEKGMNELNGTAARTKRPKCSSVIETILSETGPLHIKELVKKLNERGVPMGYQSLSGILQLYSKAGKKFIKVSPATYALLEPSTENTNKEKVQTIVYELDEAEPKTKTKTKKGEGDVNQ